MKQRIAFFSATFMLRLNLGYFEAEGLTVELTNGGGSNNSMTALISNEADIALLGPETAVYVAQGGTTNQPKIFWSIDKKRWFLPSFRNGYKKL